MTLHNRNDEGRLPSSWIILILLVVLGPFLGPSGTATPASFSPVGTPASARLDVCTALQDMPLLESQGLPAPPPGRFVTSSDPRKQESDPFHTSQTPEPAQAPSVRLAAVTSASQKAPDVWSGVVCPPRSPPFLG